MRTEKPSVTADIEVSRPSDSASPACPAIGRPPHTVELVLVTVQEADHFPLVPVQGDEGAADAIQPLGSPGQ